MRPLSRAARARLSQIFPRSSSNSPSTTVNATLWLLEAVGAQRPASRSFSSSERVSFSPLKRRMLRRKRMAFKSTSGSRSKRSGAYSTGASSPGRDAAPTGQMAAHCPQEKQSTPLHRQRPSSPR